jgi:hypothetical protein
LGSHFDNTAGAQAAGYIVQLDRALHHLAVAGALDTWVAVEHFDDVAVGREDKLLAAEQDKTSTRAAKPILGDRSKALWRTLQIWLVLRESPEGAALARHLLFVNHWVETPIAGLLKDWRAKGLEPTVVLEALRKAGKAKGSAKVDTIIADVMARSDEALLALIEAIEVVVAGDHAIQRAMVANGLGLDPRANVDVLLDGLLGWLTTKVRIDWSEGRPARISRRDIVIHSRTLEDVQRKSSFLPRGEAEIDVAEHERQDALKRNFVEHMSRVAADDEDVFQAIDHFIKFNIEKHRLVLAGDIPDQAWTNRSDRLRLRWGNILRRRSRQMAGQTASAIGQEVLAEVTYEHRESIDGQPCEEIYMTAGHYHRLAETDDVWWDPTFTPGGDRED